MAALRPGRLVRDAAGKRAITLELASGGDARTWKIMRLEGGTSVEPEPSLAELGTVTQEHFLEAIDNNRQGRKALAELFPEHVKTILGG